MTNEELKARLEAEDTELLQDKLLNNSYTDEARELAIAILKNRNATIPTPKTVAEQEQEYKSNRMQSNYKFIAVAVGVFYIWFSGDYRNIELAKWEFLGTLMAAGIVNFGTKRKK